MPVGIFLLVSAITALSVYAIEQVESQRSEAQDRQMSMAAVAAVERLANTNIAYLKAGAAMLSTRPVVDHAAFREFARQLERDDSLRGGGALAYARLVPASARAALETTMQAGGEGAYRVHPPSTAKDLLPVIYVEPKTGDTRTALGYDVLAEPVRREAAQRAFRSGQPATSGALKLLSADGTPQGFGVFVPVRNAEGTGYSGLIARGFNAQGFLTAAMGPEQLHGYGVALVDEGAGRPVPLAAMGAQAPAQRRIVRQIVIADRLMSIELSPPPGRTLSNLSLLTLLFGMMVAALLLVVARLITQQAAEDRAALAWFEEQASIRNSLTRELNHRVKNTLANVLSIVALTRRRTDNIDDFVTGLIGRVRALSATHDLLTQSEWGTTPIVAVVGAELAPYAVDSDRAVAMRGPHVELAPNDALSLGLAIHELATNASKYGALSVPGGSVDISWEMITDRLARVDWVEKGGPPVPEKRRSGFGTELIEKIVAHELRNPVDLRFGKGGVRCTLIVPVRAPAMFQLREREG